MQLEFYGLRIQPFGMAPDRRFFFASETHRRSLAYLKYGLHQGEGFVVVAGAVGTGKSVLATRLLEEVNPGAITAARIATTQLEPEDALRLVLSGFGLDDRGDKARLLQGFGDFLRREGRAGRQVLLIVDEAQALLPSTLEELRMLSNLSADGSAALQCFLFGQPQIMGLLARPELEQVRQRVVASSRLDGLSEAETRAYVEHRLAVAGWTNDPVFAVELWVRLHDETGGIPRRINLVCSRLLLYGALEELHRLEEHHLEEALKDLRQEALNPAAPAARLPPPVPETAEAAQALKPLLALLATHDAALHRILAFIEQRTDESGMQPNDTVEPLPADAGAAPDEGRFDGTQRLAAWRHTARRLG